MGTTKLIDEALDGAKCDFSSGLSRCRDDFERGGFANSPFVSSESLSVRSTKSNSSFGQLCQC